MAKTTYDQELEDFRQYINSDANELAKVFNGTLDKYEYSAYDLPSVRATFLWFCITKAVNGRYPTWVNHLDIRKSEIKLKLEACFYSLYFTHVLIKNRRVVTKFETDNMVPGAPEVYVDNPLCLANDEAFWSTTLDSEIVANPPLAHKLVEAIKELYCVWARDYC